MASARYETVNTKSFKMFFRDIKTSIRIIHAFWACGKKSIWTKIYLVKAHIESWTNKGVGCFFEVKSKWWTSQAILHQKSGDRNKIKENSLRLELLPNLEKIYFNLFHEKYHLWVTQKFPVFAWLLRHKTMSLSSNNWGQSNDLNLVYSQKFSLDFWTGTFGLRTSKI